MTKRLLILLMLLAGVAEGLDKTPYKFMIAGNYYSGARTVDSMWLAARFDAAIAGLSDFPGLFEDMYFIRQDSGEEFIFGPYASIMEVNLATTYYDSVTTYETRLADVTTHWLYVYSKAYLDSIGTDLESLLVHIADDSWTLVNSAGKGDNKTRSAVAAGHTFPRLRFNYQSWQNPTGDSANGGPFWPSGYVWLANGKNADARNAIANSFRRHFIEDSAGYEDGAVMYTAYFSDNYYRDGANLLSYTSASAHSGGPTSGFDLYEQPNFYTADSCYAYYDNAYAPTANKVMDVLDSTTTANGLKRIIGFVNINKFSAIHLGKIVPYVNGVSIEGAIDYQKGPSNWRSWYDMADTMANHPEVYINWGMNTNACLSGTPGAWNADSNRIYMAHYTFFLHMRDTNAYMSPGFWSQSFRWRTIHEVDFGEPDSAGWTVSYTGNGDYAPATPYIYLNERTYKNGSVVILFRTAHATADYAADSAEINLHDLFKEVDANADTSETADSIFYLRPYDGKILITAGEQPPSIGTILPASGYVDSTDAVSAVITDDYGVNHIYNYIWPPDSVHGVNDSISIFDSAYTTGDTAVSWTPSHDYVWTDSGQTWIVFVAADDSSNVTRDSNQILIDVQAAPAAADSVTRFLGGYYKGVKK